MLKSKTELLAALSASASNMQKVRDAAKRLKLKETAFESEPTPGAQSPIAPSNIFQGKP